MNIARQVISRPTVVYTAVRALSSVNPIPAHHRLCYGSQTQPSQSASVLRNCSYQTKQIRLMSSTQAAKFEVINVQDEDDFKKRVLESSKPVVVDFHATWCGPCKLLGPRLEKLLSEGDGSVLMAKVDIDDNSDLAMEYGVRSVPTVMGIKGGKVQGQFIGLVDDDKIQTFVDKLVVS